jgi:hypothetical protein
MKRFLFASFLALAGHLLALTRQENPPLPGFDLEGSDSKAVQIANEVMSALGGRKAWDQRRYLTWNFFGRRTHVWDKHTGDLRFENEGSVVLMNLNSKKGRVWRNGQELKDPAELEKALYDADPEPAFRIPWLNWERHGRILLSADRGERKHQNLAVLDSVPRAVFQSPEALDLRPHFR